MEANKITHLQKDDEDQDMVEKTTINGLDMLV